jgi:tetratricopeptide (TPR) repeat protein
LAFELKNYKKAKKYINLFLSEKPRNINKLFMKAECYESEEKFNQAKNVYEKILEIQPYNQKAKEIFASL